MSRIALSLVLILALMPARPVFAQALTWDGVQAMLHGEWASLTVPLDPGVVPAAACDPAVPGRTHAILVGADTFGRFSDARLEGSAGSVALLAEALIARGVARERIAALTGGQATRGGLERAVSDMLAGLSCTDHVMLYLTAVMTGTDWVARDMAGDAEMEDFIARFADSDPAMRAVAAAAPFLYLNPGGGPVRDVVSAGALSDLVARLRNRSAHVALVLDTTFAQRFDVLGRQIAQDARAVWAHRPRGAGPDAEPLAAGAGALSLFYSADRASMAAEMRLPEDAPGNPVYSLFAYKLAAAIRAEGALTAPALARRIDATVLQPDYQPYQNHVIEATDPALPLLAELAEAPPAGRLPPAVPAAAPPPAAGGEVIRITAPAALRAAARMDSPRLRIAGRVDWPEDTLIVLVGRQQAVSFPDGRFEHEVTLEPGLNRVEVVALTRDNRQHTRVLEFAFEGDREALVGAGRRYALLIGNQTYGGATGMPSLETPHADIDAIAAELTGRYGFVTEAEDPGGGRVDLVLRDATRAEIETALFRLSRIAGEADQVLVWYGGHGIYEQVTGTAFWVPADAVAGVPPTYVSASGISEALLRLQAGSVIVVSDSCYSGALLRSADAAAGPDEGDRMRMLQRLAQRRSRVLITSGANEPVADGGGDGHSVFARAFLTALREMPEEAFTARELFDGYVLPIVVGRSEQEPQFRPIARSGHEGGDFVFVRQGG